MNEKVPFFVSNSSASRSLHQANRTLTDWTTACFPANRRMRQAQWRLWNGFAHNQHWRRRRIRLQLRACPPIDVTYFGLTHVYCLQQHFPHFQRHESTASLSLSRGHHHRTKRHRVSSQEEPVCRTLGRLLLHGHWQQKAS